MSIDVWLMRLTIRGMELKFQSWSMPLTVSLSIVFKTD
jgi:hypothetical protein